MRNISVNNFKYGPVVQEMLLKEFSIFSFGGHFVQWSGIICAICLEGIMGNIHVKLF